MVIRIHVLIFIERLTTVQIIIMILTLLAKINKTFKIFLFKFGSYIVKMQKPITAFFYTALI